MSESRRFEPELLAQTLRPTRVAVLVPIVEGWEGACVHLIQILTGMWGGPGSVIVPFRPADGHVDDAVWKLVERFDPDVWARYHHTAEAIEMDDPARFEELVLSHSVGHEDEDHWVSLVRDDLRRTVVNEVEPPPMLLERIRAKTWTVSEFQLDQIEYLATNQPPIGTMTVEVAKLAKLPTRIVLPDLSVLSDTMQLLFASRWGSLNHQLRAGLAKRDVAIVDVAVGVDDERELRLLSWGLLPRTHSTFGSALHENGVEYPAAAPVSIGLVGLGRFHRGVPTDEVHVVVLGSSFDDFALAFGLRRERQSVLWCPFECGQVPSNDLLVDLLTGVRSVVHLSRAPIVFASRSLDDAQMQLFADALVGLGMAVDVIVASDWEAILMAVPPDVRLLDEQTVAYPTGTVFLDERGVIVNRVDPGMPTVATQNSAEMLWWTDILRDQHRIPRRRRLASEIVVDEFPNTALVRVGNDGVTFFSQTRRFVTAGATLEQLKARPQVRYPDALSIFQSIAEAAGVTLRESDKGAYARHSIELWGDRSRLADDLGDQTTYGILAAWLSGRPSGVDPGNLLNGRRYLSFQDLQTVLTSLGYAGAEPSRAVIHDLLDRYLVNGVIRRGLCLKCANCRGMNWYDADDVGQSFRCQRCRSVALVISDVTRGHDGHAAWYYSLQEVIYQALHHDCRVPLLAAAQLAESARSVLWMSEQEVTLANQSWSFEADIWMVIDGEITVGEAKSNGELAGTRRQRAREAVKYQRLADALTADRVVFASCVPWQESSLAAIGDAFKGHRINPEMILINSE